VHNELRKLLPKATGSSGFVVAVNLDVRGFSSFAKLAESSEAAIFLKRVSTPASLDDYFSDVAFFRPTGDGLLVLLSYDSESLIDVLTRYSAKVLNDQGRFQVVLS
jgi:hypothetical protein